jgi:hypothetical protein
MDKAPIFLAASIPEHDLDRYVPDPVAIREAIRALVAETVRDRLLVFGGHPAISPLVEHAARTLSAIDNVRIYQSEFFRATIPPIAKAFPHLLWTREVPNDRDKSLTAMREEMIKSYVFAAGVFIGGMEGVEEEWAIFHREHPHAPAFPVASTEGAARLLWQSWTPPSLPNLPPNIRDRLDRDVDYRMLFHDLLV